MADIKNDREALLSTASPRVTLTGVLITSSKGQITKLKTTGTYDASSFTLTPTLTGFSSYSTKEWFYSNSSSPNTWVSLGTGSTKVIATSSFITQLGSGQFVNYKLVVKESGMPEGIGLIAIYYVDQGTETITASLIRSSDIVQADSSGKVVSLPNSNAMKLYASGTAVNTGVSYGGTATKSGLTVTVNSSTGEMLFSESGYATPSTAGKVRDLSQYGRDIYLLGDARISSSQANFGSSSISFGGTTAESYIETDSSEDFNLFIQDFTVEFFIKPDATCGYQACLLQVYTSNKGSWELELQGGNQLTLYTTDSSGTASLRGERLTGYCENIGSNQWTHIAIVKNQNDLMLFANGEQLASLNGLVVYPDNTDAIFRMGSYNSTYATNVLGDTDINTSRFYGGYIDDIRVSLGVARYTASTYTIPTTQFPTASGSSLNYDPDAILFLNVAGNNANTGAISGKVVDVSKNGLDIKAYKYDASESNTPYVTALTDSSESLNNTKGVNLGIIYIDTSGQYYYVDEYEKFTFTGDFCIDLTAAFLGQTNSGPAVFFTTGNAAKTTGLSLGIATQSGSSNYYFATIHGVGTLSSPATNQSPNPGEFTRFTVIRRNGTLYLFINGILQTNTLSYSGNITAACMYLGAPPGSVAGSGNGYEKVVAAIRYLRISDNLIGYYFSTSAPKYNTPTTKFPTTKSEDKLLPYVSSLYNFHGTTSAGNPVIVDTSSLNNTVTVTGKVGTGSLSPFASSSSGWSYSTISDDGLGGITLTDNDALTATNTIGGSDYTIEFFMYLPEGSSFSHQSSIVIIGAVGWDRCLKIGAKFGVSSSQPGRIDVSFGSASSLFSHERISRITIEEGKWHHIAIVKKSTTIYTYIDGYRDDYNTLPNVTNGTPQYAGFSAGYGYNSGTPKGPLISNFRYTIGSALYSESTYTIPSTPLQKTSNTKVLTFQDPIIIDNSGNNWPINLSGLNGQELIPFGPNTSGMSSISYNYNTVGSSLYFSRDSYLSIPYSSQFNLGTTFTIEGWIYPTSRTGTKVLLSIAAANTTNFAVLMLQISSSGILQLVTRVTDGAATTTTDIGKAPLCMWTHFAVSSLSGTAKVFTNGIQMYAPVTVPNVTGTLAFVGIGGHANGASNTDLTYQGCITELKVIPGVAKYNAVTGGKFTPSRVPTTSPESGSILYLRGTSPNVYDVTGSTSLTLLGTSSLSSSVTKFGSTSLYLNGTTDAAVLTANYALANTTYRSTKTGNTYEMWVYPTSLATNKRALFGSYFQASGGINIGWALFVETSGALSFSYGTNVVGSTTGLVVTNSWSHIAMVFEGGHRVRVYVNGVQALSITIDDANVSRVVSATYSYPFTIGATYSSGVLSNHFQGYIDSFRVTKVPRKTTKLKDRSISYLGSSHYISNPSDIYYKNTSLLLQFDGTPNSNNFETTDKSLNRFKLIKSGSPRHSTVGDPGTSHYLFGNTSLYLNGSSQLYLNASDQLYLGTIYTVEAWFCSTSASASGAIVSTGDDSPFWPGETKKRYRIELTGTSLKAWFFGESSMGLSLNVTIPNVVVQNQWTHVALVRINDKGYVYVGGELKGTVLNIPTDKDLRNPDNVTIGRSVTHGSTYFTGYIQEIRFTKGIARYTSNFTPVSSYSPSTYTTVPISINQDYAFGNTTFLLAKDPNSLNSKDLTNNVTEFSSTNIFTIIDESTNKYCIDMSDGHIEIPITHSSLFSFTGDFTIEMLVKFNSVGMNSILFTTADSTEVGGLVLSAGDPSSQNKFRVYISGNIILSNSAPSVDTWYHIAVVRSSGTINMFINGVRQVQSLTGVNTSINVQDKIYIGRYNSASVYTGNIDGRIADLRVTKGTCRYTANFAVTPSSSTSSFVSSEDTSLYDKYYENVTLLTDGSGTETSKLSGAWTSNNESFPITAIYRGRTYTSTYNISKSIVASIPKKAYAVYSGSSITFTGNVTTTGESSLPEIGAWSAATAITSFSTSYSTSTIAPAVLYQTDGVYSPTTNTITWSPPYLYVATGSLGTGTLADNAVTNRTDTTSTTTVNLPIGGTWYTYVTTSSTVTSGTGDIVVNWSAMINLAGVNNGAYAEVAYSSNGGTSWVPHSSIKVLYSYSANTSTLVSNTVRFTALPQGTYIFRIRFSTDNDSGSSVENGSLVVTEYKK